MSGFGAIFQKLAQGEPITAEDVAIITENLLEAMDRAIDMLLQEKEEDSMGAFDGNAQTIDIHSKLWDAHEMVTARVVPTVEDEEWVNDQVLKMVNNAGKGNKKGKGFDIQSNLGATQRLWLERLIVSWTFTKGGLAMPVTSRAIKQLPSHYADYIYKEIMKQQPEEDEEEDEDFTSDVSDTTGDDGMEPDESEQEQETPSRNYLSK